MRVRLGQRRCPTVQHSAEDWIEKQCASPLRQVLHLIRRINEQACYTTQQGTDEPLHLNNLRTPGWRRFAGVLRRRLLGSKFRIYKNVTWRLGGTSGESRNTR
jgi:hypothetical protein